MSLQWSRRTSAVRLPQYVLSLYRQQANPFAVDGWKLVFWAIFEPTLTIVAACIPVVRTFLRDLVRSFSTPRISRHVEGEAQQRQGATRSAWAGNIESALAKAPCDCDKGGIVPGESNAGKRCEEGGMEGQTHDSI
jgi:hypothetical protein